MADNDGEKQSRTVSATNDVKMHQSLARGDALPSGSFGVAPLSSHSRGNVKQAGGKGEIYGVARGAPPPINRAGGMNAQANANHGKHDNY